MGRCDGCRKRWTPSSGNDLDLNAPLRLVCVMSDTGSIGEGVLAVEIGCIPTRCRPVIYVLCGSLQENNDTHFHDTETGVELEVINKESLVEWIANSYKNFGATLEFITNRLAAPLNASSYVSPQSHPAVCSHPLFGRHLAVALSYIATSRYRPSRVSLSMV